MGFDHSTDLFRFPFPEPPAPGTMQTVAPGVLWGRLPLPMTLDHVNIYALEDGDGWALIDAGINTPKCRAEMEACLAGPLGGKPITKVILTHHHPDHIGLAAGFVEKGADLLMSRTSYLLGRMLTLDAQDSADAASRQFWWRCGMEEELWKKRCESRPFNFCDMCELLPLGYSRVEDGDVLTIGARDWKIRVGHGHAPEHLTLWSDDGIVISGDQIIPGISSNIGVYATEPEANPLEDWLTSCAHLRQFTDGSELVLPGHKLPFYGAKARLDQLIDNHVSALERLHDFLETPKMAPETFPLLFKRKITASNYGLALAESIGHLNYLWKKGDVIRRENDAGRWLWSQA